jgi:serine/threonine protein kinase
VTYEPTIDPRAPLEGRYDLGELISEGGMGAVWRARHRVLDRPVAIKFMSADLRKDPEMRGRFSLEARVASALAHPNIVTTTDFGIDPERGYFLVMELLHGQSLRQRIDSVRLKARVACDIVEQVAWALRYIHSRGIMHCDLKPENIFLAQLDEESRRRNHVKLIDFGLAFRSTGQPTALAGTPPYLAPERLRGAPPSPLSDLYSLGAVFYEMLTGRVPYEGSLLDIVDQQMHGELPPPPSTLISEPLEPRADDVVLRALAIRPGDRQHSVEAFLFELRTLMSMMGMRVRRVTRVGGTRMLRRSRTPVGSPLTRQVRVHDRQSIAVPVTLRGGGTDTRDGVAENVSPGGIFVAVHQPPATGTEVEVVLPVRRPGDETLIARAVVRWQRSANDAGLASGCGLEWLDPTDGLRSRLAGNADG